MKMNKKIAGILFLAVFSAMLPLFSSSAQESSVGIRMQPAIIEDLVDPGESFKTIIYVTNLSDSAKTYYLVSRDIMGMDDNGTPLFAEQGQQSDYSLSAWIVPSTPSVYILSGEVKEVPVTINVPRDADPGSHFAGIFVSFKPPKLTTIGSGVGYEVATIISLQVAGDANEEARIRQFSTGKFIYTKPEVDFKTVVENLGNVMVRARGPLEITDIFGKKVAQLVVNDQGAVVLPESMREFKSAWTGEGFKIGRYQAVLGLVYGNNGRKTITATTSFWILPLNFILISLVVISGFIVLFFTIAHLYIRRRLAALGAGDKARLNTAYSKQGAQAKNLVLTLTMLIVAAMLIVLLMVFFA